MEDKFWGSKWGQVCSSYFFILRPNLTCVTNFEKERVVVVEKVFFSVLDWEIGSDIVGWYLGDLKWLGAIKERERTTKDEAQTLKINGLSGKCQGLLELFFDLFLEL